MSETSSAPQVAAVVPAHDESLRIAATVRALRSLPGVDEVVVVDDGSRDATADLAAQAGARVVRLARNQGKGAALAAGAAATTAPVILLADADLEDSAANLDVLLQPLLAGTADVAIAAPSRAGGPSGFGLVEGLAGWGIKRLTGRGMDRPLSGQRALRAEVLRAVGGFAPRFGAETAFTVDALRAGSRVVEVPCDIRHARTGRDPAGFVHRARQGVDVALVIAGRWRRPK